MTDKKTTPRDLISVIIPVYNAEKYIAETLDSVLAQTYDNVEIVLADDRSSDGTWKILDDYAAKNDRIRLVYLAHNGGASVARNAALGAAHGKYAAFLDSDDIWERDKLAVQHDYMVSEDAAFSFTAHDYADENGRITGGKIRIKPVVRYADLMTKTMIATSTVMINLEKIGAVEMPPRRTGQDYAFWLKLLRNTDAYGIDRPLTHLRRRGGSLSGNKLQNIRDVWEVQTINEGISKQCAAAHIVGYCVYALTKRFAAKFSRCK